MGMDLKDSDNMKNDKLNEIINDPDFIEDQLFEAKHALFAETNVRRIKFLQNKINFLKQKAKTNNKR